MKKFYSSEQENGTMWRVLKKKQTPRWNATFVTFIYETFRLKLLTISQLYLSKIDNDFSLSQNAS